MEMGGMEGSDDRYCGQLRPKEQRTGRTQRRGGRWWERARQRRMEGTGGRERLARGRVGGVATHRGDGAAEGERRQELAEKAVTRVLLMCNETRHRGRDNRKDRRLEGGG